MTKRLQLALGAIFFALLFIYAGAIIYKSLSLLNDKNELGWVPGQRGNRVIIGETGSPSLPLQQNDEIIAINGQPFRNAAEVAAFFHDSEPGTPYKIQVRRNGQVQEFELATREVPLSMWMVRIASSLIIPNIFLVTGFVVFLLKPYDKKALLLALMFGMFLGALAATWPSFTGMDWWLVAVMLTVQICSLFLWPVFFHFFLIFPEPTPIVRKHPRLEFYIYLPHLLTIFPYFLMLNILAAFRPEDYFAFRSKFSIIHTLSIIFSILYIAAGLLALFINYRLSNRPSRRKMRVVVAGSIAGFLPMFLFIGVSTVFNLYRTAPRLSQWLSFIVFFSFPLFPLSFAYAIVRHQVIPIRLILRRGVRYLLVSRGFIIIQAIVVFSVLSFLLTGSRMAAIDRLGARADILATMVTTAAAIALLTIVNHRVMPIIDRRFFREAYDAQQILSELGQEMRKVTTAAQLTELAAGKIQNALYTENVTIFLRDIDSGNYVCAITSRLTEDGASSCDSGRDIFLPGQGFVVKRLANSTQPLTVDFLYSESMPRALPAIQPTPSEARVRELTTLRRIRAVLLAPIATKDALLGIISLGPRLGDLPYSREDRQLLMALTWQMAFALQNAELVKQIAEEERLQHELEIATTVQQRLFPQHPPELERVDLSGVCHPARGVGGDYYDFILLDGSKVGIAVADVAGKGISAALLMSTVQASLRSQAASVNGKLTELVSSMNRLLHVATDASSYATFFYAQYDDETRLLTYVNAGHNPPLLIRQGVGIKAQGVGQAVAGSLDTRTVATGVDADSGQRNIRLLTTGGLIIGAFPNSRYQQETIQLQSGDLLVAYTDGVTEAFNSRDEEFSEAALQKIAAQWAHISAAELSQKIVDSVREWCGKTPQHDDLTLVVMKVK